MKKTKVITKLIAIILSILVVVQVAPMSTFAETIETESEKFEESGYSTEVSQEEEDPIVIGEDVDRRDSSNTKYFKMSDGTIKAAVYKDPVLYQDSAGKWQEIDNTLETSVRRRFLCGTDIRRRGWRCGWSAAEAAPFLLTLSELGKRRAASLTGFS